MTHINIKIGETSIYGSDDYMTMDKDGKGGATYEPKTQPVITISLDRLNDDQISTLGGKLKEMEKSGAQIFDNNFRPAGNSNDVLSIIGDNLPQSMQGLYSFIPSVSFAQVEEAKEFIMAMIDDGILESRKYEILNKFERLAQRYSKKNNHGRE